MTQYNEILFYYVLILNHWDQRVYMEKKDNNDAISFYYVLKQNHCGQRVYMLGKKITASSDFPNSDSINLAYTKLIQMGR